MATSSTDRLDRAQGILDEVHANLPRIQGTTGTILGDQQTQRIHAVLDLLVKELRSLR